MWQEQIVGSVRLKVTGARVQKAGPLVTQPRLIRSESGLNKDIVPSINQSLYCLRIANNSFVTYK